MEKKSKGENKPTQNRSRKEQFLWENYIVVYEEKIFALRDVEGNGDCFYSSLLFHPKVRKSFDTVMEIRKFLKEYVTEIYYHNENIRKLFKFEKIGIKTWKKKVIRDGIWGTTLEMMLLTFALNLEIITIGNYLNGQIGTKMTTLFKNITGTSPLVEMNEAVYLFHYRQGWPEAPTDNPDHFGYLLPYVEQPEVLPTPIHINDDTDVLAKKLEQNHEIENKESDEVEILSNLQKKHPLKKSTKNISDNKIFAKVSNKRIASPNSKKTKRNPVMERKEKSASPIEAYNPDRVPFSEFLSNFLPSEVTKDDTKAKISASFGDSSEDSEDSGSSNITQKFPN